MNENDIKSGNENGNLERVPHAYKLKYHRKSRKINEHQGKLIDYCTYACRT